MDEAWLIFFAAVGVLVIGVGLVIVLQLMWLGSIMRGQRNDVPRPLQEPPQQRPDEAYAPPPDLGTRKQEAKDQKKLFKDFINERPEILDEPKKTQFDEFRQWREARGL